MMTNATDTGDSKMAVEQLKTMHGKAVHELLGDSSRCGLRPQQGDEILTGRHVTCRRCLKKNRQQQEAQSQRIHDRISTVWP